MAGVTDHTELDVYKLSDELRKRVRAIVARPIFAKDPKLRRQLGDAAESPCPNIGEGFSRFYPVDNARFVRTAKGSLTEVIEHLKSALQKGLIEKVECEDGSRWARRARGAATGFIRYLENADIPDLIPPSRRRKTPSRRSHRWTNETSRPEVPPMHRTRTRNRGTPEPPEMPPPTKP